MSISRIAAASGFSPDWVVKYSSYSGDSLDVVLAAGTGNVADMFFKPDGMSVYVISSENKVSQYDLTVPWDITTGTYEQTVTVAGNLGLYIKPDGTRMYVRSASGIHQYSLSVAWDISTFSFMRTRSVSSESRTGLWFSSDGVNVFYPFRGSFPSVLTIRQLQLSVPWVIDSSAVLVDSFTGGSGFYFSDDEQYLALVGNAAGIVSVYQNNVLLSSYDASDQDGALTSVFFENPRTFYLLGRSTDLIFKYNIA